MVSTSQPPLPPAPPSAPAVPLGSLFLGFFELALSSSGGALAPAHRVLVDKRGWLTNREFTEILALCQVLPGPNVVNLAIYVGGRYHGAAGAAAAFAGLLLAPLLVIVPLMVLYAQSGQNELVRGAFRGVAAAAAGLMVATSLKVALPYRHSLRAVLLAALAFAGVSLLHWPLLVVVLVLAPCGVVAAWRGWL
ncbi:MAG TPA: chromate transporter [Chloroflexota bacterium]|nr:chromate transporter [Chloroflexota bacterium]